jgi:hypothetical protein
MCIVTEELLCGSSFLNRQGIYLWLCRFQTEPLAPAVPEGFSFGFRIRVFRRCLCFRVIKSNGAVCRKHLAHPTMMNDLRLSYCLLVLLGVGVDCRPLKRRLVTELGDEVTTAIKSKEDFVRNLRQGHVASAAAPGAAEIDRHRRDLASAISGNNAGAISPTDNPNGGCLDNYGVAYCLNGCPSLWYAVKGTGLPMTASTCGFANYDTRIIVWGGTSCSDKTCIGTSKKCLWRSTCKFFSLLTLAFFHSNRQQ